jgi:YbbR domain-containing protein
MLEAITANWPLKLLSLALAFAVWVSVTGDAGVVQDYSVPLDILLADESVLASTPPNTVTVRFRGSESLMRRLDPVPIAVRIDLRDSANGERDVQLSSSDLQGLPRGVEVDFIEPDRLSLTLDRRMRRDLPVETTFLGQPPDGYAFFGERIDPERLWVEGPEAEVEPMKVLRTSPIRLDQRTVPFSVRVTAVPAGPHVRVVDPRPVEVDVVIDVTPVERTFEDLPVRLRGQAPRVSFVPRTLTVTLAGPPRLVERIDADQIHVLADLAGVGLSSEPTSVPVFVEFFDVPIEDLALLSVKSVAPREISVRTAGRTPA